MSETIPYIIAENGYYYVAYKEKVKVPEIVVSSKGVANGLSEEYNDGWDFGPDSYSPSSTSAIPYTQTTGIQEAMNYALKNNIGTIQLGAGTFDTTNAPFVTDPNTGRRYKIYIPAISPTGTNPVSLTIIGSSQAVPSSYGSEIPSAEYPSQTVIYDGTVDTTAPLIPGTSNVNTANDFIFGVMSTNSTSYLSSIMLYIDGIIFSVQANYESYLGGVDTSNALLSSFGRIRIQILSGQTRHFQPATGLLWVISDGIFPEDAIEAIDVLGWQDGIISSFGHTYIGYAHAANCVNGISFYTGVIADISGSNYTGTFGQFECENVAVFCNVGSGPLQSSSVTPGPIHVSFNSFNAGDLTETSGPLVYQYSILIVPGYPSNLSILLYNLGASSTIPKFSISGGSRVNILTWGTGFGVSNYEPDVSTPSVPASGSTSQNTNPYPVKVYVNGGALTEIQISIGGTSYTVYSNSTASAVYEGFTLPAGASITLTYTTAPTWEWVPE